MLNSIARSFCRASAREPSDNLQHSSRRNKPRWKRPCSARRLARKHRHGCRARVQHAVVRQRVAAVEFLWPRGSSWARTSRTSSEARRTSRGDCGASAPQSPRSRARGVSRCYTACPSSAACTRSASPARSELSLCGSHWPTAAVHRPPERCAPTWQLRHRGGSSFTPHSAARNLWLSAWNGSPRWPTSESSTLDQKGSGRSPGAPHRNRVASAGRALAHRQRRYQRRSARGRTATKSAAVRSPKRQTCRRSKRPMAPQARMGAIECNRCDAQVGACLGAERRVRR